MNKPLLLELLDEMERNVRRLEDLRALPRDEFIAEPRHHLYAERCFQIAIQCLIDACTYLAAQHGWDRPESSVDAMLLMGRQGVFPAGFAERTSGMASFRNVLVHAYLKINRGIVYDLLDRVDELRECARLLLEHLDSVE